MKSQKPGKISKLIIMLLVAALALPVTNASAGKWEGNTYIDKYGSVSGYTEDFREIQAKFNRYEYKLSKLNEKLSKDLILSSKPDNKLTIAKYYDKKMKKVVKQEVNGDLVDVPDAKYIKNCKKNKTIINKYIKEFKKIMKSYDKYVAKKYDEAMKEKYWSKWIDWVDEDDD